MFTNFRDLIAAWPTLSDFASDLGIPYGTAKQMRRRDSINASHWDRLVGAAAERGIANVDFDALAKLAARSETARIRAA